jgi:hypothetical protein
MDMVMVALQYIEPSRKPLVSRAEDREIMEVLDLMVDIELVDINCSRGTNWRANSSGGSLPTWKCAAICSIAVDSSRNMAWRDSQKRAISPRFGWASHCSRG